MRRQICKIALIVTLLLLIATPVMAAENMERHNVTFKMMVPEGVELNGTLYIIYTGATTDVFAELNADNNWQTTCSLPIGSYYLYQIMLNADTPYTFLALDSYMVTGTMQVNIYMRDENGYVNDTITEEVPPENIAEYGIEVANKKAREDVTFQAQLSQTQQQISELEEKQTTLNEQVNDVETKVDEVVGNSSRKITTITATEDRPIKEFPYIAICIVGMCIISGLVILLQFKNKRKK